jgi:hypothetical protein
VQISAYGFVESFGMARGTAGPFKSHSHRRGGLPLGGGGYIPELPHFLTKKPLTLPSRQKAFV